MTSSLVGSEMCIRDRLHTGPVYNDSIHLHYVIDISPPGAKLAYAETVSYTHLTLPTICSV
eukprot:5486305-Prorocentrum_lima.AAC.1